MRRIISPEGQQYDPEEHKNDMDSRIEWLTSSSNIKNREYKTIGDEIDETILSGAVEIYEKVVDSVYPELLSILKKSGVHEGQDDKKNLISKDDIKDRVIFDFSPKKNGTWGLYDVNEHVMTFRFGSLLGGKDVINVQDFIKTAVHEMIHFISYTELNYSTGIVEKVVGYNRETAPDTDKFKKRKHIARGDFGCVNEGVVEGFAQHLSGKVFKDIDLDKDNKTFSFEPMSKKHEGAYLLEREVVSALVDYLAEYAGVPVDALWNSIIRGLLEGVNLGSEELIPFFEECFGVGVVEDFLVDFDEKDNKYRSRLKRMDGESENDYLARKGRDSVDKRWMKNGKKSISNKDENALSKLYKLFNFKN